jgi:hypothetical protein
MSILRMNTSLVTVEKTHFSHYHPLVQHISPTFIHGILMSSQFLCLEQPYLYADSLGRFRGVTINKVVYHITCLCLT